MNADKSDATVCTPSVMAHADAVREARDRVESPVPAHEGGTQGTTGAMQNFKQYAVVMALFVSCRP